MVVGFRVVGRHVEVIDATDGRWLDIRVQRRDEVRHLLRMERIANVVDPDAGIEPGGDQQLAVVRLIKGLAGRMHAEARAARAEVRIALALPHGDGGDHHRVLLGACACRCAGGDRRRDIREIGEVR